MRAPAAAIPPLLVMLALGGAPQSARGAEPVGFVRSAEGDTHGKDAPLVPTGDNVPEPRNRRVEVTVR